MNEPVDLAQFKTIYPAWKDCSDAELEFWSELSGCLIRLPTHCPQLFKKLPVLILAHVLKVNNVTCVSETTVDPVDPNTTVTTTTAVSGADQDACSCDDDYLNKILAGGATISSASIEGLSVSFDNAGINTTVTAMGKSQFSAWLSQTPEGRMVLAILSRLYKGPFMVRGSVITNGAYGDDMPIINKGY